MNRLVLGALAACAFVAPARAQQTTTTDTTRSKVHPLNPVVVSASKRAEKTVDAPAHVEVISADRVRRLPATNLADHLRATAGVDVIDQGMFAQDLAVRGFNTLFLGGLMVLADNRIASLPSLRANVYATLPVAQEDIERMEVVLGPGSALYGPNAANGVLHIITKSPLDESGSVATIGGGNRNVFTTSVRSAHRLGSSLGFKVSAQYLAGDEWRYTDPAEASARQLILPRDPATRVGLREFDTRRWSGEARLDWRFQSGATAVFSAGSSSANGIMLSGIGATQMRDWRSSYVQTRLTADRLFAQVYLNTNDSGDSFFLRTDNPAAEHSRMLGAQLQHGHSFSQRQSFTYGADYLRTMPDTRGLLHGANEDIDNIDELGAYVQSETRLHARKLDLVLASRADWHSALEHMVFSPRAALVFKPAAEQSVRLTYNRAFSTPAGVNLFIDFDNGPAGALGPLGYNAHIAGNHAGFQFATDNGVYRARSPFTPAAQGGPGAIIGTHASTLYQYGVNVLAARGQISAQQAAQLRALAPGDNDIGLLAFNPFAGTRAALGPATAADVPRLTQSTNQSLELGYQGVLAQKFRVSADVWYSRIDNFVSRPQLRSPLVLLNGPDVRRFLAANDIDQADAQALANALGQLPLATLVAEGANVSKPSLLLTYVNFGQVELYGADFSVRALLAPRWSLEATASLVSDDHFQNAKTQGELIPLNAPRRKGGIALAYDDSRRLRGELRVHYSAGFPASTGVYLADKCVNPQGSGEDCIASHTIADASIGYRVPRLTGVALELGVTNLFDRFYRSFAGAPEIGRLVLLRARYEF
jgi:iron complex outermembrane receptor protein